MVYTSKQKQKMDKIYVRMGVIWRGGVTVAAQCRVSPLTCIACCSWGFCAIIDSMMAGSSAIWVTICFFFFPRKKKKKNAPREMKQHGLDVSNDIGFIDTHLQTLSKEGKGKQNT